MGMRSIIGVFGVYSSVNGSGVGDILKRHTETMVRCHIFYLKDYAL